MTLNGDAINLYGDRLRPSGPHGSNISEQRVDELDQACIDYVRLCIEAVGFCRVADIGGGSGAQGKRLATLGAEVLIVDLTDQQENISRFNKTLGRDAIHFVRCDVRKLTPGEWPTLCCVYSQRMLGCIPYFDALQLLQTLKQKAAPRGRFFLSSGGLDTEYGRDYPDRYKPVKERFAYLSTDMAEKHGIFEPECLYREKELRELMEEAGLSVIRSWTSPFGNPKVIATCT
jgi:hypothetical protein